MNADPDVDARQQSTTNGREAMSALADHYPQKTPAPIPPSGPSLREIESKARTQLERVLSNISARHAMHSARLKHFSVGNSSGEIKIVIDGPDVWEKVNDTQQAMCDRIKETIQQKYGGKVQVSSSKGSVTLLIIFSAIEVAKNIFDIATSVGTIVEYTIRCVEQSRFEWPPVATMFTFF
jgi:hypothetical protein